MNVSFLCIVKRLCLKRYLLMSLVIAFVVSTTNAYADGMVVDKVYHPYVLPNETEIEWRLISRQTDHSNQNSKATLQQTVPTCPDRSSKCPHSSRRPSTSRSRAPGRACWPNICNIPRNQTSQCWLKTHRHS